MISSSNTCLPYFYISALMPRALRYSSFCLLLVALSSCLRVALPEKYYSELSPSKQPSAPVAVSIIAKPLVQPVITPTTIGHQKIWGIPATAVYFQHSLYSHAEEALLMALAESGYTSVEVSSGIPPEQIQACLQAGLLLSPNISAVKASTSDIVFRQETSAEVESVLSVGKNSQIQILTGSSSDKKLSGGGHITSLSDLVASVGIASFAKLIPDWKQAHDVSSQQCSTKFATIDPTFFTPVDAAELVKQISFSYGIVENNGFYKLDLPSRLISRGLLSSNFVGAVGYVDVKRRSSLISPIEVKLQLLSSSKTEFSVKASFFRNDALVLEKVFSANFDSSLDGYAAFALENIGKDIGNFIATAPELK